jgi:hypothetical protein
MKRLVVSILLLVYFTVSTGFVVNLHYCMDKINSIEFGSAKEDKCGKCGMPVKDKKGCCREEAKVIKLQQDVVAAHFVQFNFVAATAILPPSPIFIEPVQLAEVFPTNQAHAPPLISKQYTYLLNCVFRI